MKYTTLVLVSLMSTVALAGCSDAEEYEVTGEISSSLSVSDPIALEFFEENEDAERESVKQVTLDALGAFTETVEVSPDSKIVAFALVDADGDGACTEGELWAEAIATPKDDGTVDAISLALIADACPAVATEE